MRGGEAEGAGVDGSHGMQHTMEFLLRYELGGLLFTILPANKCHLCPETILVRWTARAEPWHIFWRYSSTHGQKHDSIKSDYNVDE